MKTFKYLVVATIISGFGLASFTVQAGEATAQLSATIKDFVTILNATPVAELRATGLPEKARKLIFARFDFSEMTKRALGANWEKLGQQEQGEFVGALTQRLLVSYGRTVRSNGDETIQFNREIRQGDQASVETKVLSDGGRELPIDYRLHQVEGQWKVYDVSIDQVSMVNNFRAQFDRVIARSSLKILLQKVKDQDS